MFVLNLVISGIPSIQQFGFGTVLLVLVLNLVISGIPSIPKERALEVHEEIGGFKPCYKWNTFNTKWII